MTHYPEKPHHRSLPVLLSLVFYIWKICQNQHNKQKEYYQHKIPYTISDFGNLNVKFFGTESPTSFAHYLDGIDGP